MELFFHTLFCDKCYNSANNHDAAYDIEQSCTYTTCGWQNCTGLVINFCNNCCMCAVHNTCYSHFYICTKFVIACRGLCFAKIIFISIKTFDCDLFR